MHTRMANIRLSIFSWILVVCYIKSCFGLWYMGCYTELGSSNFTVHGNSSLLSSGVACSSLCYDKGYTYAALNNGAECKCSSSVDGISIVDGASCSIRCSIDYRQFCGGNSSLSVYSVDEPYIRNVEVTSEQTLVQESTEVYLEAEVVFADILDGSTGLPEVNDSLHVVQVTWRVNRTVVKSESTSAVNSNSLVVAYTHRFQQQGFWRIDVEVENPISSNTGTTSLTVVPPAPRNLQVLLKMSPESVPSCIPVEDTIPVNLPSVAVFLNEEVMLQASVSMGINLTFVWDFEDGSSNTVSPYLAESECSRITCMQQHIQNHTFTTEGIEKVSVNVSNSLGSLSKELYVVVVKRQLGNLSLIVDDTFESYYTKPNTAVTFLLTLLTSSRQNTYLEIDFGDGKTFNSSLQDENDTFIGGGYSDSKPNLHLLADYGESCTLFISFQHQYQNSGIYYVKTTVFGNNLTLRENLEKPITIQNVISNSRLIVNSPYAIGPVNNFTVRLTPLFSNVSSNWANTTFYWELFLHNSSISTVSSRDAFFLHAFTEVGRYAVAVNISNFVSFDYVKAYFIVQETVEGLSIGSTSPLFISLGSNVHVMASINKGTNVTFKWDFGETGVYVTQSPVALVNRYQESSSANYTYWKIGTYSITVTAKNSVSQLQATLPNVVTVEQKVSGFSLMEVPPTILGDPTEIFAVVVEGSHVRFTIDIGEGPENITASEEDDGLFKIDYDFHESGVYHVSITAFNDVSSVDDEVCVIVQAHLDDVQVAPISDVVVGQVSKFVLNHNGAILDRPDLLFQWSVDGTNITSVVPFLTYTFHEVIGSVRLEVLVSNLVAVKTVWVEFEVFDSLVPLSMDHHFFVEVGEPVSFQIRNMENLDNDVLIEIYFGDNNSLMLYRNLSEPLQLTHIYNVPGVYEIKANITSDAHLTDLKSILSKKKKVPTATLR